MLVIRSTAITSLMLAGVLALPAAAQQPKACAVDEGKPANVARAYLTVSQVASATPAAPVPDAKKRLMAAVESLTKPVPAGKTVENPVGSAYELGKLLVLWSVQPGVPLESNRGLLGYASDPAGSLNLPAAIDSEFTIVETAMPECESETLKWRSQKAWLTLVNGSIQELNAGSLDSADLHAHESMVLNHRAPYGYMVMAQVAQRRNQTDHAIDLFRKTIAAASDTSYAEVRYQSLVNLGNIAQQAAETDAAASAKYLPIAKEAYSTLYRDTTASSGYRIQAGGGLVDVYLAMHDTASAKALYQGQITNPSAYTFNDLVQAGVWASRVGDSDGSMKAFEAAYQMNPYHRDALSNLALIELKSNHFDKALMLVNRLQSVDPDGNNGRLLVYTYAGLAKMFADSNKSVVARYAKSKSPKVKQILTDSASLTTDSNRVYTDLALKANSAADSMPVLVTFSQFSNVDNAVTLTGSIENKTDASKTYTMKVDFLDKTGAVVVSQTATVGPVASKASGRFSVTATAPGIMAFKYAPLTP